jgi:hypothetical protein
MFSEFLVYLRLGFEHIADPRGYDHILFIVALTATYVPRDWRRVVALVTAFTVGHSVTLALATLGYVRIPTDLIELLIPVTILLTTMANGIELRRDWKCGSVKGAGQPASWSGQGVRYAFALVFGLIHGLGFSNFLRAALGGEASIVWPLFAFNVGLEVGQVLIVAIVLTATALATGLLGWRQLAWAAVLSGAAGTVAMYLVWQRLPLG